MGGSQTITFFAEAFPGSLKNSNSLRFNMFPFLSLSFSFFLSLSHLPLSFLRVVNSVCLSLCPHIIVHTVCLPCRHFHGKHHTKRLPFIMCFCVVLSVFDTVSFLLCIPLTHLCIVFSLLSYELLIRPAVYSSIQFSTYSATYACTYTSSPVYFYVCLICIFVSLPVCFSMPFSLSFQNFFLILVNDPFALPFS